MQQAKQGPVLESSHRKVFRNRFLRIVSNAELFGQDHSLFSLLVTMIAPDCSYFTYSEQKGSVQYVNCAIKSSPKLTGVNKTAVLRIEVDWK